jgi:hypothetical protein
MANLRPHRIRDLRRRPTGRPATFPRLSPKRKSGERDASLPRVEARVPAKPSFVSRFKDWRKAHRQKVRT